MMWAIFYRTQYLLNFYSSFIIFKHCWRRGVSQYYNSEFSRSGCVVGKSRFVPHREFVFSKKDIDFVLGTYNFCWVPIMIIVLSYRKILTSNFLPTTEIPSVVMLSCAASSILCKNEKSNEHDHDILSSIEYLSHYYRQLLKKVSPVCQSLLPIPSPHNLLYTLAVSWPT